MSEGPALCISVWERYRNVCRCGSCRGMERARSDYIDGVEEVNRLERIGGSGLNKARAARDAAGKRWASLGKANPDYGKSAGARFVPSSAAYSRPGGNEPVEDHSA